MNIVDVTSPSKGAPVAEDGEDEDDEDEADFGAPLPQAAPKAAVRRIARARTAGRG